MSAAASGHGGGGGAPTKKSFDKQFKVLLLGDSGMCHLKSSCPSSWNRIHSLCMCMIS